MGMDEEVMFRPHQWFLGRLVASKQDKNKNIISVTDETSEPIDT